MFPLSHFLEAILITKYCCDGRAEALRFMLDLEGGGERVSLLKNEWLGGEKQCRSLSSCLRSTLNA